MSQVQILTEFKKNLIIFFDELIALFPQQGDLVIARLFIANQMPLEEAMNTFIYKLNLNDSECRTMIKERNEKFFLEHEVLPIGDGNKSFDANVFKTMWISGTLEDEDKEVIWKWIDTFVYFADKFIKTKNPS